MRGSTLCVTASVPNTLTSNRRRTRSSGTSAIGPVWPAPALLISTSMSHAAAFATSARRDVDLLDRQLRRLGAQRLGLLVGLGGRDHVWPRSASARLAPLPNPEPAPVIITVLDTLFSWSGGCGLFDELDHFMVGAAEAGEAQLREARSHRHRLRVREELDVAIAERAH